MAVERQIPGEKFINESGSRQAQIPGGPFVNETVSIGGSTFNPAWARNSNTMIVSVNSGSDQK